VEELQTAKEFILALRAATLENGDLDADAIHRLRNPMQQPINISDKYLRLSLDQFLSS
ncbi:hypothetical protein B0H10DRAFT_1764016, partial [Mycena sp. CBHHK59/15]